MQQEQPLVAAAEVAAAMLRFCEEAAYPSHEGPPQGWPRTTDPCYIFRYSNERVLRDNLAEYLEGLPGPVLLSPTLTARTVVATLLDDLNGAASTAARARFEAQEEYVRCIPGLDENDRVLLAFDDETSIFTAATLLEWSRRYAVEVFWSFSRLKDDARANLSMDLLRIDGHRSQYCREDI